MANIEDNSHSNWDITTPAQRDKIKGLAGTGGWPAERTVYRKSAHVASPPKLNANEEHGGSRQHTTPRVSSPCVELPIAITRTAE